MSARGDMIVASLTSEWRSTRDILDSCEAAEGISTSAVYHTLNMAVKYRQAEKRVVEPKPGVRVAEWRRAP
jgi:hypothetical protein